jgi:membrane associated rhomboid family serine protease
VWSGAGGEHVSETERDSGWSEQYAETGGWPPPVEGQRRYGPGVPPADPSTAGAHEPTQRTGPTDPPPGQRPQSSGGTDRDDAGHAQPGQWDRPDNRPDQWGYPAGQPGQWGGPAGQGSQWGPPPGQAEPGGSGPSQAWAPGDSAYGRLGRRTPPPRPQQRPRRPWEGRPAPARGPAGTPVVTITLIAICVVIYLVQQANPAFTARYALIPFDVQHGQYARLVTSAFLHASLLHLGTNMITLYIVGAPLERVLRPVRYLIVYLLSALGGSLLSVWLSPEFSVGVGASGAIFGLFGALVVLRRQVGADAGALAVLIGLNLVISFTLPNISWQAHIGGLVTGVLVALVMRGVDRISARRRAG